jgi:FkbM family methyltransferase
LLSCDASHIASFLCIGFYYERAVTQAFEDILSNVTTPGTRVLDVGGNIGYFTLLSAALAPIVVEAFEPNMKNSLRFCESKNLNHWDSEYDPVSVSTNDQTSPKINLYPFGVGPEEGYFDFIQDDNNPGMGKFRDSSGGGGDELRVITLDKFAAERGWFESRPDVAILKVDVEGREHGVIKGANELLKANIIRNILMEVSARTGKERQVNGDSLHIILAAGYKIFKYGGWPGPSTNVPSSWPSDTSSIVDLIMNITVTASAKQLNLWWVLDS